MPLARGSSQATVSANIGELVRAGHDPKQAAAIAYRVAGEAKDDMDQAAFDALVERVSRDCLATDESMRIPDEFGRMFVKTSHISKATVNPYYGREIPGWQELGLEANRVYKLLRDPEELRKAAPSFNGVQLLLEHVPVSGEDPQQDIVVGCTGTNTAFNLPYLDTELSVWTAEAIALIEDDEQRELSACYGYEPDMTPGNYDGEPYDGVMRNIRGNHVALVKKGRAGSDVLVADAEISPRAAGVMATAPNGEMLFLKRGKDSDHPGEWCFPGGMIEPGETPEEAARRELREETGHEAEGELKAVDDADGFVTHTYQAPSRFRPALNDEHTDFRWAAPDKAPQPLHPGVAATLAKDADPDEPYGDVAYADPGYQADKQKRYPLDTEEHVRAAWNYIHKGKDSDKYSPADLAKVKARIASAWKRKIDGAGPPAAQDSSPKENSMAAAKKPAARKVALLSRTAIRTQGAIMAGLNLAADASIDLRPLLKGFNAKTFDAKKAEVWAGAKRLAEGKFASDEGATPDDVMMRVLDMVQKEAPPEEAEADETTDEAGSIDPNAAPPAAAEGGEKDDKAAKLLEYLKSKGMGEDEIAEARKACGMDDMEAGGDPQAGMDNEEDGPAMKPVTKEAMDAALAAHGNSVAEKIRGEQRDALAAREFVRPWVGEVALALDSAPAIYRATLKTLGVADADSLPEAALQPILRNLPKPGPRYAELAHHLAADASAVNELDTLLPHLARIGVQA